MADETEMEMESKSEAPASFLSHTLAGRVFRAKTADDRIRIHKKRMTRENAVKFLRKMFKKGITSGQIAENPIENNLDALDRKKRDTGLVYQALRQYAISIGVDPKEIEAMERGEVKAKSSKAVTKGEAIQDNGARELEKLLRYQANEVRKTYGKLIKDDQFKEALNAFKAGNDKAGDMLLAYVGNDDAKRESVMNVVELMKKNRGTKDVAEKMQSVMKNVLPVR